MNQEHDNPTDPCPAGAAGEQGALSDDQTAKVAEAVEEYLAALEQGRQVDRQEFLARHADIAGELAECLDGVELIHAGAARLAGGEGDHTWPEGQASAGVAPRRLSDYRIIREIGRRPLPSPGHGRSLPRTLGECRHDWSGCRKALC
jgi:hypothetical protein